MRVKLYSDLHTEFWPEDYFPSFLTEHSDVLILAGDIAVGLAATQKFLSRVAAHHEYVIYLPGNHEYYGHALNIFDYLDLPHNVYYLNPGYIVINNVMFVGATLWTNFNNNKASEKVAAKYITDFRRIKDFSTNDAKTLFNTHSTFIRNALESTELQTVVVTHFLPSKLAIHPRWAREDYPTKQLNDYFANDLDDLILTNQPNYWLFGHTHESIATKLGDTILMANPFGYLGHEVNPRFDENFTIEI